MKFCLPTPKHMWTIQHNHYATLINDTFKKIAVKKASLRSPDFSFCIRSVSEKSFPNLHAPLCGIFHPNSVAVARYGALIRAQYPTNCDAHLAESLFRHTPEVCLFIICRFPDHQESRDFLYNTVCLLLCRAPFVWKYFYPLYDTGSDSLLPVSVPAHRHPLQ